MALSENQERYRALVDAAPDAVLIITDMVVVYANTAAARLLAADTAAQLVGRPIEDFIQPDHWEISVAGGEPLFEDRTASRHFELRALRLDGTVIDVEIVASYLRWNGADSVQPILRDISERKRSELELADHRQQLESLIEERTRDLQAVADNVPVLISRLDTDLRWTFVNRTAEQWFAHPSDEIVGKSIQEILGAELFSTVQPQLEAVLAGESLRFETTLSHPDGNTRDVDISYRPDVSPTGDVTGLYGVALDITDRKRAEKALRESEERFREVLEVVEEVVWETNAEGRYSFLSKSARDVFGVDHDKAIGMKPTDFVTDEEERDAVIAFFRDVVAARSKFSDFQYRITTPNGRRIWVSGSGAPLLSPTGELVGYRGTAHDVTAKRQAEEALRKSEESYRSIFDNAQVGIIRSRISDGRPLQANDRLAEILGYENAEDAVNNHRADNHFLKPEDREAWIAEGKKYGYVRNFDGRLKRKDGSIVHISSSASFDPEQNHIDVVMVDQSDRMAAEERRKASEMTLSGMLEIAPDAIIATGEDLKISIFNQGAENVFGWEESEVLGQSLDVLIPENLRSLHLVHIKEFLSSLDQSRAMSERGEIVGLRKDGSEFPARASISKLHLGSDTMLTVILHDITEQKRGEAELVTAKETAEYADRAKSEFLANMSHELRTPLNAIMGFAQMIKSQSLGAQAVERYLDYADNIFDSGGHLLAIIDDILDLSKVDAGKLELDEREFDLAPTLEACETLIMGRAGIADVSLAIGGKTRGLKLLADERLVKQMLLNLLSNAVKFTPPEGRLTLTVQGAEDGRLAISVADTGIGMAQKDLAIALSPFGQIESALTRGHEGTGLGLPIVAALAELHGGELVLQSEPGVGTKATIWFPKERVVYG